MLKDDHIMGAFIVTLLLILSFATGMLFDEENQGLRSTPIAIPEPTPDSFIQPDPCALDAVVCPGEIEWDRGPILRTRIEEAASAAGIDPVAAVRIAQCESSLDVSAVNADSGALGLFQFLPSTWTYIGSQGSPLNGQDAIDAFVEWYPKHPEWWVCK